MVNHLYYRIKDLVIEMAFWNDTIQDWDAIYERNGPRNESNQFDMAFYPYEGNSTLLCHTLKKGLNAFGTKFRILPASSPALGKPSFKLKFAEGDIICCKM
jgi:hypothetical protein